MNEAQEVLVNATNQTVLELEFSLVSDDFQGQQYTCRAQTEEGTMYNETVEIRVVGKF